MNDPALERARLICRLAVTETLRELDSSTSAVFALHAHHGRLRSGSTVQSAATAMTDVLNKVLAKLLAELESTPIQPGTFELFSNAIQECLAHCESKMVTVGHTVCNGRDAPIEPRVKRASDELLRIMRETIETKVRIAQYKLEPPPLTNADGGTQPKVEVWQSSVKNGGVEKRGRPRAEYWDQLWAHIAASLYLGDLVPKTQADLERAMSEWLESNAHSAAVSTVRERAKRLWDLISKDAR